MQRIPYIPENYIQKKCHKYSLWFHPNEPSDQMLFAETSIHSALCKTERLLRFSSTRALHFCVYHSNQEARAQLERDVPVTMFMAPFSSSAESLVIFHAPGTDPKNADKTRMLRHLVHKITHLFLYEKSGSTHRLGDHRRDVTIPTWFDEGVAEVVAHRAANEPIPPLDIPPQLDLKELDRHLDDLGSPKRPLAFFYAMNIVWNLVQKHTLQYVFEHHRILLFHTEEHRILP